VVKVYNLCRVKTDISAMLTITSSLDPHMIIDLKNNLICGSLVLNNVVSFMLK
jgi:hypothetical protein